jgi:hypothetical protein
MMSISTAKEIHDLQTVDSQQLWTSLDQSEIKEDPYRHYILKDLFDSDLVEDLLALPFEPHQLDYRAGTREEFNSVRHYITPQIIEQHGAAQRISDAFLAPSLIQKLEAMGGIVLKDSLLRIEYAIDSDKFWLKPHTDLGVKLVTLLIYLSKDENAASWGTDIYQDADHFHSTVPYQSNTALLFFPTDKTWHGFEPRSINGVRKSLIVNFVTQEWRNRQELVHPTRPVY